MHTSWKRRLLILPPVIVGIAVLVMVLQNRKTPEQQEAVEQSRIVRTITIAPTTVVPRVLGYGTVEPGRVWNAVAQVSGRIIEIHPNFKKGALLKQGTQIVRIAPEEYEIAIRQAEANIRSAEARLNELTLNRENTRASLALEQQSLAINEKELKRKNALAKRGAVSASTLDQETANLLNQRKRVLELENALKLAPSQIEAQQEQKAVSQAQLETAKLNLKRTRITLPFDVRVAQTNVEVTQYVAPGTVLGIADSVKRAEISAQIPLARFRALLSAAASNGGAQTLTIEERSFAKMIEKMGMHAIVRVQIGNQTIEWPGKVIRISDTIDPKTRTVGAIVAVDDSYSQAVPGQRPPLVKGMFAEVEVRVSALNNAIIIPRSAMRNGSVYLANKDNRLEIRKVAPKLMQGDFVVIERGLKTSDRLIVSDLSPATKGMLLDVVADKSAGEKLKVQAMGEGPAR